MDAGHFRVPGGKMKSTGTQYWFAPNSGANNESGFSGLPGGTRYWNSGDYDNIGMLGVWWSATKYGELYGWAFELAQNDAFFYRDYHSKTDGASVRCVRD